MHVLAIDHRWQMEAMADAAGVSFERLPHAKWLLHQAARRTAERRDDVGLLVDDQYGSVVVDARANDGSWLARAVDVPRSRPVSVAGGPIEATLASWPAHHVAKLMVYADPDDPADVADAQWAVMTGYVAAGRSTGRDVLIEFQPPGGRPADGAYLVAMLGAAAERGVAPAWWKLPPVDDAGAWRQAGAIVVAANPACQGILVLGQDTAADQVGAALASAAGEPVVRGFAIGRAIFGEPLRRWLASEVGDHDDEALIEAVSHRFTAMIDAWQAARQRGRA